MKLRIGLILLPVLSTLICAADAQPVASSHAPVLPHRDQHQLLLSEDPQLAENKALVYDFWRHVIVGGKAEDAPLYMNADFTEHNPLLPSGAYAFQEFVADRLRRNALQGTIEDLVAIVAEGPYVVLATVARYLEEDGSGGFYTSTRFDLFRIDGDLITEHWDSRNLRSSRGVPDYGMAQALPVTGVSGAMQHAVLMNADPVLFANKRLVFDLWRQVVDAGRAELAELYVQPVYIEHDPGAEAGLFAERADRDVDTALAAPLVASVAEGDLVVQVLAVEHQQDGVAYRLPGFDMFRIVDGRVSEHWNAATKGKFAVMQRDPLGQ